MTAGTLLGRVGSLVLMWWRGAPGPTLVLGGVAVVGGTLPAALAWATKLLIDALTRQPGTAADVPLWVIAVSLGGVGLVAAFLPHVRGYAQAELDRRLDRTAQDRLYASVNGFNGLARFEDPRFLDTVRLAEQAGSAVGPTVSGLFGLTQSAVVLVTMFTTLAALNPLMTVLVLGTALPAIAAQLALSRRRARLMAETTQTLRRRMVYGDLLTDVQGAKEVRLLGLGSFLQDRMRAQLLAVHQRECRLDRRELLTQAALAALAALVAGAGLLWCVRAALRGELSVGDVSVFIAAVAAVQGSLASSVDELARAHEALLLFGYFQAVTTAPDDLPTSSGAVDLPALRRGIELRDVWFRYGEEAPWVLRGVNLFIPAGRSVAIVGLNGAGKSTLIKLLLRFYDPTRGTVLWDGIDLRDAKVESLRRRVGAVFQDYMSYDFSAADNIGFGDLDRRVDLDAVRYAAALAGVDGTLERLPQGYQTLLSRSFFVELEPDQDVAAGAPQPGMTLSGGQWQRIAIARALMRGGRDLMILDEPSSGLDAEAEHAVHARLREHRRGRTSLLVSHRLGAVREADRIVVLNDGRVEEEGTHGELVAAQGRYARLFALQAAGYVEDAVASSSEPN